MLYTHGGVIEIRDLYKYYGDRRAVGPLSFSIEPGQIVGLLGLNGAGKTTTLRILACDLLPSSGRVTVDGIDVVDRPDDVRRRIGYLPDTPPLYDEMTVRRYLQFAAKLRGVARDGLDRAVDSAIASTELESVADDLIRSLSHGFRQRVGIAQAIVHRPRLLVLDEPTGGLDPVQIVEMRSLLKSLRGDHTILLSSHILSEISQTCDQLLVIQNGEIKASGTEEEVVRRGRPGHTFSVCARGGAEALSELCQTVEGVERVSRQASDEAAEDAVLLEIDASTDVREALVAKLVGAGHGVLSVAKKDRALESAFLQLTEATDGTVKTGPKGARRRREEAT